MLFMSLMQARPALEEWRQHYNTVRPHSRVGWLTLAAQRPVDFFTYVQA
jgi:transposase InsO family protein